MNENGVPFERKALQTSRSTTGLQMAVNSEARGWGWGGGVEYYVICARQGNRKEEQKLQRLNELLIEISA